ncbi:MAG: LpxD N-terminal domain-containing protein, partial [Xanthobacteraceae bacterium]
MPDFFATKHGLTIGEIVTLTGARVRSGAPSSARIDDIAPLDRARPSDITFLDNAKYVDGLAVTRAGACLLAPRFEARAPDRLVVLMTSEPYRSFVAVARALFPAALRPSSLFGTSGRSADARVHA